MYMYSMLMAAQAVCLWHIIVYLKQESHVSHIHFIYLLLCIISIISNVFFIMKIINNAQYSKSKVIGPEAFLLNAIDVFAV